MHYGELFVGTVLGLACTFPLALFSVYGDGTVANPSWLWTVVAGVLAIHSAAALLANLLLNRRHRGIAWVVMLFPTWIISIGIGIFMSLSFQLMQMFR